MGVISVNEIYVLCPAYIQTGGPELLHQFVYNVNRLGGKANIVYVRYKYNYPIECNKQYSQYITKFLTIEDIKYDDQNLLIVPETLVNYLYILKNKAIQKAIWWLSVDAYWGLSDFKYRIKKYGILKTFFHIVRTIEAKIGINYADYHLYQSYYAGDWLRQQGFDENKIFYLSDYLNEAFFDNSNLDIKRENIIIYNPKKGLENTKFLMNSIRDYQWIPIENMKLSETISTMRKAKLYVDFGNHPGKDRMPREAAICGCCIITGKAGSAKYSEDVGIPDGYKFDNVENDFQKIKNSIDSIMLYYDENIKNFSFYREKIKNEIHTFEECIRKIFL